MTKPLVLSDEDLIGKGSGRLVYRHPENHDLVVKIQKPRIAKPLQRLRDLSRRERRRFLRIAFSWKEIDGFAASVANTGAVPQFCSQFRGFIQTNKGIGCLFDLVRSPDGDIAPTLAAFAKNNQRTPQITKAIDDLWDGIQKFGLVVWDAKLDNVLVAGSTSTKLELVLVDGIGEKTAIPVMTLSNTLRTKANEASRVAMKQSFDAVTRND